MTRHSSKRPQAPHFMAKELRQRTCWAHTMWGIRHSISRSQAYCASTFESHIDWIKNAAVESEKMLYVASQRQKDLLS